MDPRGHGTGHAGDGSRQAHSMAGSQAVWGSKVQPEWLKAVSMVRGNFKALKMKFPRGVLFVFCQSRVSTDKASGPAPRSGHMQPLPPRCTKDSAWPDVADHHHHLTALTQTSSTVEGHPESWFVRHFLKFPRRSAHCCLSWTDISQQWATAKFSRVSPEAKGSKSGSWVLVGPRLMLPTSSNIPYQHNTLAPESIYPCPPMSNVIKKAEDRARRL